MYPRKNLIFLKFILSCALIFTPILSTAQLLPKAALTNIALVVSSCDKYSALWPGFFKALFAHWPTLHANTNNNIPIYLIANKKSFPDDRITTILTPDISWSDNLIIALKQIKEKYVLIMLDDYFIQRLDITRLSELYQVMQETHSIHIGLFVHSEFMQDGPDLPNTSGVYYRNQFGKYKTHLQAGIWEKDKLLHLLRPKESAWDFEIIGTIRSHGIEQKFLGLKTASPISYVNIMDKGYITDHSFQYLKENNLLAAIAGIPIAKEHRIAKYFKDLRFRITSKIHYLSYIYE